MNLLQKTFWDMLFDSVTYCNEKQSKWNMYPAIASKVAAVQKTEQEIRAAANLQGSKEPIGHINKKNSLLLTVGVKFSKLCSTLQFFAGNTSNKALQTEMKYADWMFTNDEEKEVLIRCNAVLKQARVYVNDLSEYDVTAEKLDALETDLRIVEAMPAEISLSTENQKAATRSIATLISEARISLEQLDKAFYGMVDDDLFLEGWDEVRKIKGRPNSKAKTTPTATTTETN
jgi:hypothetical protein